MTDAQILGLLNNPKTATILIILAIWDLAWKGVSLWKASKNNSMPWFIALLVLNTIGILPIIYVFFFSKKKNQSII